MHGRKRTNESGAPVAPTSNVVTATRHNASAVTSYTRTPNTLASGMKCTPTTAHMAVGTQMEYPEAARMTADPKMAANSATPTLRNWRPTLPPPAAGDTDARESSKESRPIRRAPAVSATKMAILATRAGRATAGLSSDRAEPAQTRPMTAVTPIARARPRPAFGVRTGPMWLMGLMGLMGLMVQSVMTSSRFLLGDRAG